MEKIKRRNIKKDAKFSNLSRSARLYGIDPIWKVTLKVASTGLLTSFFLGLFTFVDQLMLVNFMPNTERFSFNTLFYKDDKGVFNSLLEHINNTGGSQIYQQIKLHKNDPNNANLSNLVNAISNATGLGFVNSATIVRSAVSLTTALSIIVNAIPSLFSVGAAVKYTQAIGIGDYKKAAYIWQNSFIGCIASGLLCFCLLVILIPTVIPAQNVYHKLNGNDTSKLVDAIEARFTANGWVDAPYIKDIVHSFKTNKLGTSTIYYTYNAKEDIFNYYIKITNNEYLDISANSGNSLLTVTNSAKLFSANQIGVPLNSFTYNLMGNDSILST